MTTATATIRAMLLARYPQFSTYDADRIDAFIEDARLSVPVCKLGSRADLALMYKAGSLFVSSLTTSADGSGGEVKRKKDADIEIEYFSSGSSESISSGANDLEAQYQALLRGVARNSPRVLGYRG